MASRPPRPLSLAETQRWRILVFHENKLSTPNPYEAVDWQDSPEQFLHYYDDYIARLPLLHLPPRGLQDQPDDGDDGDPPCREALYSELFSYSRFAIPSAHFDRVSLSQFLYDSLAISEVGDEDPDTGFLPRVSPSSGGSHPTEAHIISSGMPDFLKFPFAAHYSAKHHALEILAGVPLQFFDHCLPPETMLVGLSTVFWREAWRHGDRAFRYCHLDVGHTIAAVTFAAAALGWGTSLLDGLGQRDLEMIMGLKPYRPDRWMRGRQGPGEYPEVESQEPVCVLIIFRNRTAEYAAVDIKALSTGISNYFKNITWFQKPISIAKGKHVVHNEIYRTAKDVERPEAFGGLVFIRPTMCWGSKTYPGFSGYENFLAREVARRRSSTFLMDWNYHMEVDVFYQFLHHCLPSGYCSSGEEQREQLAFPFGVLPWDSKIDVFIFVHRVRTLRPGLYCLVRNGDHFLGLKHGTSQSFKWEHSQEWGAMGLPLYELLSRDLQGELKEIACGQPTAMDGCFTVMMVGNLEDIEDMNFWMYPRLFWEAGVLGQLLSMDAQALGISACEIGSFIDEKANSLLGFKSLLYQTLYMYAVGKPLSIL